MKGRKSPRLIIHPSIAPGLDVVPVAVMIGSPIRDGGAGKPYVAVVGSLTPGTVIIQVLIAHDIRGNVARGVGVFPVTVAIGSPIIKLVHVVGVAFGIGVQLIDAGKDVGIVGVNRVSASSACDFALAAANLDDGGVAGFVHGDAVKAGAQDGKRKVGRINLVGLGIIEAPNTQEQSSRAQLNLCHVVAQIQK